MKLNQEIINTIILASGFLTLFGTGEVLHHFLKIRAELTRKMVHLVTGLITLLFPFLLKQHYYVLALCASFAIILLLSKKYDLLKSINAIDRESHGSISYPAAVYGSFVVYSLYQNLIVFYLPILILAICDPAAALTGKKWPIGRYFNGREYKTMTGSIVFFASAFLISIILMITLNPAEPDFVNTLVASVLIGSLSSITEAMSRKGFDNLLIPVSVLLVLLLLNSLKFYPL